MRYRRRGRESDDAAMTLVLGPWKKEGNDGRRWIRPLINVSGYPLSVQRWIIKNDAWVHNNGNISTPKLFNSLEKCQADADRLAISYGWVLCDTEEEAEKLLLLI